MIPNWLPYVYIVFGAAITLMTALLAEKLDKRFKAVFWVVLIVLIAGYIYAGILLQRHSDEHENDLLANLNAERKTTADLRQMLEQDKQSRDKLAWTVGAGHRAISDLSTAMGTMRKEDADKYLADLNAVVTQFHKAESAAQTCEETNSRLRFQNVQLSASNKALEECTKQDQAARYWPTKGDPEFKRAKKLFDLIPETYMAMDGLDRFILFEVVSRGGQIDKEAEQQIGSDIELRFGEYRNTTVAYTRLQKLGVFTSSIAPLTLQKPYAKRLPEFKSAME